MAKPKTGKKKLGPDFIREISRKLAARARKERMAAFREVLSKERIITYGDLFALAAGLSRRAKERAAMDRIQALASMGCSPAKIVDLMEPKRPGGKRPPRQAGTNTEETENEI